MTLAANNDLIRELADLLAHHALKVHALNGCNLLDEAIGTEGWAREAAEILLRRRFSCSNILSAQQDTFDIHGGRTIIQVTSNLKVDKVQHTLASYEKNGHRRSHPKLLIVLIGEKPAYKKNDFSKLKLGFRFSPASQIVGIRELVRAATRLRLDELRKLVDVTRAYFGKASPDLAGIEYLHAQCKALQRDLEHCRTVVEKARMRMVLFAVEHPPSEAKFRVFLEALEKFGSVLEKLSDKTRTAAMTSGLAGRAKAEQAANAVVGYHLTLIRLQTQFERIAESVMAQEKTHRTITLKELVETREQEIERLEQEKESAEFAVKFFSGT